MKNAKKKKETKTERQKEEFFMHLGMNGDSTEHHTERDFKKNNFPSIEHLVSNKKIETLQLDT